MSPARTVKVEPVMPRVEPPLSAYLSSGLVVLEQGIGSAYGEKACCVGAEWVVDGAWENE